MIMHYSQKTKNNLIIVFIILALLSLISYSLGNRHIGTVLAILEFVASVSFFYIESLKSIDDIKNELVSLFEEGFEEITLHSYNLNEIPNNEINMIKQEHYMIIKMKKIIPIKYNLKIEKLKFSIPTFLNRDNSKHIFVAETSYIEKNEESSHGYIIENKKQTNIAIALSQDLKDVVNMIYVSNLIEKFSIDVEHTKASCEITYSVCLNNKKSKNNKFLIHQKFNLRNLGFKDKINGIKMEVSNIEII